MNKPIVVVPAGSKVLAGNDVEVLVVAGGDPRQPAALLHYLGDERSSVTEAVLQVVDNARSNGAQTNREKVLAEAEAMNNGTASNQVQLQWGERELLIELLSAFRSLDESDDRFERGGIDIDDLVDRLLWQQYGKLNIAVDGSREISWIVEAD